MRVNPPDIQVLENTGTLFLCTQENHPDSRNRTLENTDIFFDFAKKLLIASMIEGAGTL